MIEPFFSWQYSLVYLGSRGGRCVRERRVLRQRASIDWVSHMTSNYYDTTNHIEVVIGRRSSVDKQQQIRPRQITRSLPSATKEANSPPDVNTPTLYVFNAASIAKPHAIESLTAELTGYQIDVAIITETHLKPSKHPDGCFDISGYSLIRRDRVGRREGVAIYARSSLRPTVWKPRNDLKFEILWVRLSNNCFIGALHHPPTPTGYSPVEMLNFVESAVEELAVANPDALLVLAGDFNQLSDQEVIERTGLTSLVTEPTRGESKLDRIYISSQCYQNIKIVNSVAKSDHRAIIAYSGHHCIKNKIIQCLSEKNHQFKMPGSWNFCRLLILRRTVMRRSMMCRCSLTTSTRQQLAYSTSSIPRGECCWRRMIRSTSLPKSKMIYAGKINWCRLDDWRRQALSPDGWNQNYPPNSARLNSLNHRVNTRELWEKIRQLSNRSRRNVISCDVTASALNKHYANISTDKQYVPPCRKDSLNHSTQPNDEYPFTECRVFHLLDNLRSTATGLDELPAWFLRLGAPILAKPITNPFNQSINCSVVPAQWKQAYIRPVNKIAEPKEPADFRPISITPVLSRMMEKMIVQTIIYPALLCPPPALCFTDQFAFRPTGSTTAAIISFLHTVTNLLASNQYVIVYALTSVKLRHSTRFGIVRSWRK